MKTVRILLAIILLVLSYQTANARIINVPADSSTIQKGIIGANDGDTVLVATGHYHENINFVGNRIMVASNFIFDSARATIDSTIIYGDSPIHPDTASVVRFISGEDSNSVICGFTIRDGAGTKVQTPGYYHERGGGIVCLNASPKILNNVISNNVAYDGGGIFCWGTSPIIRKNVIKYNEAPQGDPGTSGAGGIYITHTTGVVIEGNVIDSNYACEHGGGILITFASISTVVLNNTIIRNSGSPGAGICVWAGSDTQIKNNIVVRNRNHAAIYSSPIEAVISFNDVWDNPDGNFQGGPPGLGDTSWGENFNGIPCDSFYNIIVNPLFDPESTNYALLCSSECIDAGDTDFPPLAVGGAKIDQGAFEYPYILGDATWNTIIDAGDIQFLINYLYLGCKGPCPWRAGDANCDTIVDVGDVVRLIDYVFRGGDPPDCEDCKSGRMNPQTSFQSLKSTRDLSWVGFAPPAKLSDGLVELSITGEFDTEILAVDLEIEYDPDDIELLNPELADMTKDLQIYHGLKDGILKIGVFDMYGKHSIAPGQGTIVTLRLRGTDPSSLRISKATLMGRNAQKIPVRMVSEIRNPREDFTARKPAVPEEFSLSQNYPNPFNPETEISYELPTDCRVNVSIYNIRGQKVKTLVDRFEAAGHKTVQWNATDDNGKKMASGIYFYRIQADEFRDTKKMILMK